jgi:hypothetical protein
LTVKSKKPEELQAQNIVNNADIGISRKLMLAKYRSFDSTTTKGRAFTLQFIIDHYDTTPVVEFFRLLLERRTIPLLVPDARKTIEKLLSACSLSSEPLIAEIGVGCLMTEARTEAKTIENVLDVRDFRPLWRDSLVFIVLPINTCLLKIQKAVKSERFCRFFLTGEKMTTRENSSTVRGLDAFNLSCVWTPSMRKLNSECDKKENGFQCRIIEGLLQGEIFNLIKENVIEAFQISKLENFKKLLNEIPIKEAYVDLECVSPSEIKWNNILSVQNLSYVNKNEFILQKDYLKQVKIIKRQMWVLSCSVLRSVRESD